jgi:hypothetical protein
MRHPIAAGALPIKRDVGLAYRSSLLVALALAVVSVAGSSGALVACIRSDRRSSRSPGEATLRIADNAGPLGPTMNDRGTVAFRANLGSGGSGIYTGRDGLIASIAATGDVFSAFHGLPVINSRGVVAFRAD